MLKFLLTFIALLPFNTLATEIEPASELGKLTENSAVKQSKTYQSLAELEWKYRLILANSKDVQGIINLFNKYSEAIQERKIAWFVWGGNKLHSNISENLGSGLRTEVKRYLSRYENNDMVLIGYDGEAKSVDGVDNLSNFFDEIDRMPIRQYEMSGYTN